MRRAEPVESVQQTGSNKALGLETRCFDYTLLIFYVSPASNTSVVTRARSLTLISDSNPGPVSPRRRRTGWADLVVKVCLAVVLGAVLGHFFLPRYIGHLPPTDRERWLARPKLAPLLALGSTSAEAKRSSPCLFLFPSGGIDEPQTSGTVADCLTLVPNGKKMDVLEINLESGKLFSCKN